MPTLQLSDGENPECDVKRRCFPQNLVVSTKSPGLKVRVCKTILGQDVFYRALNYFWKFFPSNCSPLTRLPWYMLRMMIWHILDNSLKCLVPRRCFPIFLLVFISMCLGAVANPAWLRSARERCILPFLKDVRSWLVNRTAVLQHWKRISFTYIWNHRSRIRIPHYASRITHCAHTLCVNGFLALVHFCSSVFSWRSGMPFSENSIRNSSFFFAMHSMPRMYHDVLICGRSPHFSAGNEIYFTTKVPTSRNILSDNTNLLILYTKIYPKNSCSSEV